MISVHRSFSSDARSVYEVTWDNGDRWEYVVYDMGPRLDYAYSKHKSLPKYAGAIKKYARGHERKLSTAEAVIEELMSERAIDRIEDKIRELRQLIQRTTDKNQRAALQTQLAQVLRQREIFIGGLKYWR